MLELSIIVPVYNVERYLKECLDSICVQNVLDIEVILVDDGSTDLSYSIIAEYEKKYSFIKAFKKENGGQSTARNFGLKKATKSYILFVDSDDIIDLKSTENMLITAEKENADIVFANYFEFIDITKKKNRHDKVHFVGELISEKAKLDLLFFVKLSSLIGNKIYKKELLNKNDIWFKEGIYFEDLDFFFHALYYSKKIIKTEVSIYGYRQRLGSTMTNVSVVYDKIIILDEIKQFLINEGKFADYYEQFKVLYIKMYFSVIYSIVKNVKKETKQYNGELLKKVLNHSFFKHMQNEPFLWFKKLALKERFVYVLFKYKLMNYRLLLLFMNLK